MVLSFVSQGANWLKMVWVRQPIIFVSCVMGFAGPLIVYFSPWTKDSIESMKAIPEHYPYPKLQKSNQTSADNS